MRCTLRCEGKLKHRTLIVAVTFAAHFANPDSSVRAQVTDSVDFWKSRTAVITSADSAAVIRIGIWDSGVDTTLFSGRIARDKSGRSLIRGYDPFKRRQDSPMAIMPTALLSRRDELNATLRALDDLDSHVDSPDGRALQARLNKMSKEESAIFDNEIDRWSGYVHGSAVADIALADNASAEIVVARMEWWHDDPPVPCWSRQLAVREAQSMQDLLNFLVESGVRVVNMSWSRFESGYLSNLASCAKEMPLVERQSLARFTVDTIRAVLRTGIAKAPHVLFVGAAGNGGVNVDKANSGTRFSAPNFIVVGAVNRAGEVASFTNTGSEVTIYANGDRVASRMPGGSLSFPSGTSMSAPAVANAAAKVFALNPRLSGSQVRELLEKTAERNGTGQPVLHSAHAVEAARRSRAR
jgi:hypothetical protein